jgi:hypothetical protein
MVVQTARRPSLKKAGKPKTQIAGISNRPPAEERQQQEKLPPRGQAKKHTPGKEHSFDSREAIVSISETGPLSRQ